MTEISEDGDYLVRVRAQVMTRDDSSGGWVPLSGGGLANVSVRRRLISSSAQQNNSTNGTGSVVVPSAPSTTQTDSATAVSTQGQGSSSGSPTGTNKPKHEYLIYGKRTTDQSVVLSCIIKKDFEYNKVMPTFHHWRVGEKKFGLTFQTAADGRSFDEGVCTAVKELLEGLTNATFHNTKTEAGDEDVFMTVNLPVDSLEQRLPTDTPHGIVRMPNYNAQSLELPDSHKPIHYIVGQSIKVPPPQHALASTTDGVSDNNPYVHLRTLNHDYLYPASNDHKSKNTMNRSVRLRCKHCQELYTEQHNPRGSCEHAPDPIKRGISTITCLPCAQCMLYHCMSDAEGDFSQNPCSCRTEDGCGRRWFGLALLSLIVPCLWMYPPLRAIHWCGMSCGMWGARHHPME